MLQYLLILFIPATFFLFFRSLSDRKRIRVLQKERKTAALELQNSENLFQTLLESIPFSVYGKNRTSGEFIFCNRKCAGLWGRPVDEILGKGTFDLFRKEETDLLPVQLPGHGTLKELQNDNISFTHPDGSSRNGHIFCKNIYLPGGENLLLFFVEDITERKKKHARFPEASGAVQQHSQQSSVSFVRPGCRS